MSDDDPERRLDDVLAPAAPSSSSSQQPAALDYAPTQPLHKSRRFRLSLAALALGLLMFPCLWLSKTVYQRTMLLRWQRQCENFSMPPGSVAYEENPTAAAALWKAQSASGNYGAVMKQGGGIHFVLMRPKAQWEVSVNQGSNLYQMGSVFLHARRAKGKGERLVCVYPNDFISYRADANLQVIYNANWPDFSVQVLEPATYFHSGQRLVQKDYNVASLLGHPFGTVRIFAGQPDTADESHFTIDIQSPAGKGTIDGYLQADDSVTLSLRPAPTTAPATRG